MNRAFSPSPFLVRLCVMAVFSLNPWFYPVAQAAGHTPLPARVRVLLMRMTPLFEKQQYQDAVEYITGLQARSSLPDSAAMSRSVYHHPELYFVLGNCYLLQGRNRQAAEAYGKTVVGEPAHTSAWLNMAKAHYELQEYGRAGECFTKGYESAGSKNPETLYYSAASYLMAEQYKTANSSFARLQKDHPRAFKPEWQEYWVHSLLSAHRPEDAIPIMHELIAFYDGEKRLQWQEILLNQYMQEKDCRRAIEYLAQLTEESPQVAKWWKAAAHVELSRNNYENGLAALLIYSFLAPLDPGERQLLADLYLQVGIPVQAAPLYARQLQENSDPELLYRLALAYSQLGQPEKSLECLGEHAEIERNYELYMLEGEISYRLNQYRQARICFSKAAVCHGSPGGHAWLLAGYAAMQMEDFSESRDAFLQAARYEKEEKAAVKALAQLDRVALAWQGNPGAVR